MKVKVLKAEGKGKKKGLFINCLIFDAPASLFIEINDYCLSEGVWIRDLRTVRH